MKPIEDIIKAAEQGDACTQYRIGMMYLNGEGVDKDQDVAYHWLLKSAKQGYAEAATSPAITMRKRHWNG